MLYSGHRASRGDEAALRRFVEAALWICRTGAPWRDLPETLGRWPSVDPRWRQGCVRGWWERVFEPIRPALPADGLLRIDSTTGKAHRAARGVACSTPDAEALGRSRGGTGPKSGEPLGSTLHACVDGAGRVLRRVASPGHPSDLRHALPLVAALPASDLAAVGGTVHTPPKRGMTDPPPWDVTLYARRHRVETLFSRPKDSARLALRRDKARRSWIGFAHLAATMINLRIAEYSHRPWYLVPGGRDAPLTREGEEALWQAVLTAQPGRRRAFEPSSKRRKTRAAPWPSATA